MSDDLVGFLRARLRSDEAHARNAFGDHNSAVAEWHEQWSGALNIGDAEDLISTNDSQVSRFMERFDPARALREINAKRVIIDLHERSDCQGHYESWIPCGKACTYRCSECVSDDFPCPTLRALASAYDTHPHYRLEWAG